VNSGFCNIFSSSLSAHSVTALTSTWTLFGLAVVCLNLFHDKSFYSPHRSKKAYETMKTAAGGAERHFNSYRALTPIYLPGHSRALPPLTSTAAFFFSVALGTASFFCTTFSTCCTSITLKDSASGDSTTWIEVIADYTSSRPAKFFCIEAIDTAILASIDVCTDAFSLARR